MGGSFADRSEHKQVHGATIHKVTLDLHSLLLTDCSCPGTIVELVNKYDTAKKIPSVQKTETKVRTTLGKLLETGFPAPLFYFRLFHVEI